MDYSSEFSSSSDWDYISEPAQDLSGDINAILEDGDIDLMLQPSIPSPVQFTVEQQNQFTMEQQNQFTMGQQNQFTVEQQNQFQSDLPQAQQQPYAIMQGFDQIMENPQTSSFPGLEGHNMLGVVPSLNYHNPGPLLQGLLTSDLFGSEMGTFDNTTAAVATSSAATSQEQHYQQYQPNQSQQQYDATSATLNDGTDDINAGNFSYLASMNTATLQQQFQQNPYQQEHEHLMQHVQTHQQQHQQQHEPTGEPAVVAVDVEHEPEVVERQPDAGKVFFHVCQAGRIRNKAGSKQQIRYDLNDHGSKVVKWQDLKDCYDRLVETQVIDENVSVWVNYGHNLRRKMTDVGQVHEQEIRYFGRLDNLQADIELGQNGVIALSLECDHDGCHKPVVSRGFKNPNWRQSCKNHKG